MIYREVYLQTSVILLVFYISQLYEVAVYFILLVLKMNFEQTLTWWSAFYILHTHSCLGAISG